MRDRSIAWMLLLAACGSSAPRAEAPAAASSAIAVSREPWSITFENDSVLAYAANGAFSIDGDAVGTLGDDGRLMQGETVLATLASDGAMTLREEPLAPRIEGSRMTENGVSVLDIDDADVLHVRAPDGRELATFDVDGATPTARPTILFLTAIYLLESAHARRDADEAATVDERAEDESGGEGATDDDGLWRMPVDDAPSQGPRDALVTIVELTDFQCPYCARGAAAMIALRARFPDDVRLVVRQRPLPFHENARPAAEAALEARAQLGDEGFFRMAELLFANQRALGRSTLESLAITVGLDLARFRDALDHQTHEETIARDLALGDRMGAEGTPTFYVNGELIVGAQPLASFVHAVERARARAEDALSHGATRDTLYETLLAHAQSPAPPAPPARSHPAAPADITHAPTDAHRSGGVAWHTEHAGSGEGAAHTIAARIAVWDASGLVLDGTSATPLVLRLDALDAPLAGALRGITRGEIRRVWLPGPRVLHVEAVDVE
jgi:predicted DsbA family dithiol-disulfide isomerase